MSIYERIFLVNNIPQIAGIFEVRDIIKQFVYKEDWYMNKAKEFSEKFKMVNESIRRAHCFVKIKNNIEKYNQFWEFGFDMSNDKYRENGVDKYEKLHIYAENCFLCGEYTREYTINKNIPTCTCSHNNIENDTDIIYDWTEEEYQQYWDDYWYQYNLDLFEDDEDVSV